MKKILAAVLAIAMLLTTMSTCVIPASADSAGVATTEGITEEIFTETFEDYTKGENWLEHIESSYVTDVVPTGKEKDWFIYDGTKGANTGNIYQGAEGAEIMVVDAGASGLESDGVDRGQVLKIYGGSGEAKDLTLRRTVENITNMGTLGNYGSDTKSYGPTKYIAATNLLAASKGKKLVYEVKYYAPTDFYSSQANLMSYASSQYNNAGGLAAGGLLTALSGQYAYTITMGSSSKSHYARAYHFEKRDGAWHTIKIVADFSDTANKNYWHTARAYLDNKLVTSIYSLDPPSDSYLGGSAAYTNANKTKGTTGDEVYDFAPYGRYPTSTSETDSASAMKVGETHGWFFGAKNSTSYDGKALYYIDDFKAYWVDELEIGTVVNTENYKTGAIQIPFNSQIQESVTKYNPKLIDSDTTSGYNKEVRFGEKYNGTTTKTLAEVTDSTKALITIVDADNKLVEGAVKSVALSADKKTVLVTPDMTKLSGNKEYKIALDPMLCDIYGQALTSKTAATPVTNYVTFTTASAEFTAKVDKTSISAAEGDEITATVTLSEVATEEDIENAFTVTNTETDEAVTEGWSYTLSDDGTEVELDFSSLAKGSYKLTMNQITASGKPLTNASDIVISISVAEKLATDPLFNETFEDYEKDVNWLNNLSGDFVSSANTGVKENDWYIATSKSKPEDPDSKDLQIMVVDAGDKGLEADGVDRGNILMIDGGNSGLTMLSLQKTVNNITNAGTVSSDNRITYANLIKGAAGRKLVYEVDFYRPTDFYTGEAHFMANSGKLGPAQYAANNGYYTSFSGTYADYIVTMGNSNYTYYVRAQRNYDNRGAWHNMKMVVDYSAESSATNWNTARVYIDDVLVTGQYTVKNTTDTYVVPETAPYEIGDTIYDFSNTALPTASTPYPTRASLYGWVFSAKNSTSKTSYDGKAVYYIDNFKAYWIDSLEAETPVNGENYVSGAIEIPFNSEIKENVTKFDVTGLSSTRSLISENNTTTKNYKDLISIVDANGNLVEDGILNVELSDNKRSLLVTPDMNALWGGRTYKIAIDPLFSDVFGQALTSGVTSQPKTTYITFTTAKNDSLSIKSAENAIIEGSKVSTTIELSNAAAASKSAFLAVAVYNENFEMIGISSQDVTVASKGTSMTPVTVDITGYTADDVAYVKAHLWSSFADMVAYQAAENIGF